MNNRPRIIILERQDGLLKLLEWLESLWREARELCVPEILGMLLLASFALAVIALELVLRGAP